jgi:hypothetical protein
MKKKLVLILMLCLLSSLISLEYSTEDRELQGSNVTIISPDNWNGKLLLIAHGYRVIGSDKSSHISVHEFYESLLEKGWMIAGTSYRRNGMILRDAIEDLKYLENYISKNYGKIDEKYLYGRSMGGMIGVHIAEDKNSSYSGIFALGAGMKCRDEVNPLEITHKPYIPIMFLSNETETELPQKYVNNIEINAIKPILWTIDRPGHCNANQLELIDGFDALLDMCQGKDVEESKIVLHDMSNSIQSDAVITNNNIEIPLEGSSSSYRMNIRKSDLEKIGIEHKSFFEMEYNDKSYYVFWGDTYSDAPYLFWVSFFQANGKYKLARNFGNAVSYLRYKKDDKIIIRKLETQPNMDSIFDQEAVDIGLKAWQAIEAKEYEQSIKLGLMALEIQPDVIWFKVNLMHAYMFNNEMEKAKKILHENFGKQLLTHQGYFEQSVLEDFANFEAQDINHENMDKIINQIKILEEK